MERATGPKDVYKVLLTRFNFYESGIKEIKERIRVLCLNPFCNETLIKSLKNDLEKYVAIRDEIENIYDVSSMICGPKNFCEDLPRRDV